MVRRNWLNKRLIFYARVILAFGSFAKKKLFEKNELIGPAELRAFVIFAVIQLSIVLTIVI